MIRGVLRFLGAVTAVFASVLCVLLATYDTEAFPLGTSQTFTLTVGQSGASKQEIAAELDAFARREGIAVYQRAVSPGASAGEAQDLIAFGAGTDRAGQRVNWFDPRFEGSVVSWRDLGDRPLSGYFMSTSCEGCKEALAEWSQSAHVDLQWDRTRSLKSHIATITLNNGTGYAAVSVLVTLLACVIVWYVTRARSAALRLLAGVSPSRIMLHYLRTVSAHVFVPMWLTWLGALAVVRWRYGGSSLSTFAMWSAGVLGAISAVLLVAIGVIAFLGRPTVDSLATRTPPLDSFVRMGWFVRAFGVLVAVVVVPYSAQYVSLARHAQASIDAWSKASGAVTIGISTVTESEAVGEQYREQLDGFCEEAGERDVTATSMSFDSPEISRDQMGVFDGVALVDSGFLDLMGIRLPADNGDFVPVDSGDVPSVMREYFFDPSYGSVSGFLREGHENDLSLYVYHGSETVPVVTTTLSDATSTTLEGKLVVYVDDAFDSFNPGRLEATIVNGQSIFRDADSARSLIAEYAMAPYMTSVDLASDQIVTAAREYRNQAWFGVCAGMLGVLAILIAMGEAAQVWSATNRRRIFVMHSSGRSFRQIVRSPVVREIAFTAVVGAASVAFSVAVLHVGGAAMVGLVAGIVLASFLVAHYLYAASARIEFERAVHRKD